MKKIGVIALGNLLRRDDGIGIVLLEKLIENKEKLPKNIQYIDGGTGGMNILHLISRFDIILIIDAVFFNANPGCSKLFNFEEIKNKHVSFIISTHESDIIKIINLSKNLDKQQRHILFFGIQPKDTSFGTGLSTEVQQNIQRLLKKLMNELKKIGKESS